MSDSTVPVRIHKLPLLIRKSALKKYNQINQLKTDYNGILQRVENTQKNLFKEEIIYKSNEHDAFFGKYPNLIIKNRLNFARNTSRTVATYDDNSSTVELNSDAVTGVIGQKNYDTILSALCSVISQDLKVQGILSLLTLNNKKNLPSDVTSVDKSSQTDETSRAIFLRSKIKKNARRKQVRSYAVQDDMLPEKPTKKVIVVPNNERIKEVYGKTVDKTGEELKSNSNVKSGSDQLPDLKLLLDEDSNISDTSVGNLSIGSCNIPNILENPKAILNNIDKHTNTDGSNLTTVRMIDGSVVMIPGCPDIFHLTTEDILQNLSSQDRKKILLHQAYIDWKYCLQVDSDGHIPLHKAVLNNDVGLLKRQCIVLKTHKQSVDVTCSGNATALQLALIHDFGKCTSILLQHGADPLIPDDEGRTPLHLAAEVGSENVKAILEHCRANARAILKENEGLWRESFDSKSDQVLSNFLIYKMCFEYDNQGYIPLMLASRIGNAESVKILLQALPESVNVSMPNCGNTALYLAVSAACLDCQERGDKNNVDQKYLDTIGALLENGADPSIENSSGVSTNSLLTEFCISKISMLIANKFTAAKYHLVGKMKNFDSYMLLKGTGGVVDLTEIRVAKEEPIEITEEPIIKNTRIMNVIPDINKNASERRIETVDSEMEKQRNLDNAKVNKTQSNKVKAKKQDSVKIVMKNSRLQTDLKDERGNKVLLKYVPVSKVSKVSTGQTKAAIGRLAQTVSETNILKVDSQNFKPLAIRDMTPLKFVKILPKPGNITTANAKQMTTANMSTANTDTAITNTANIGTAITNTANIGTAITNTANTNTAITSIAIPSTANSSTKDSTGIKNTSASIKRSISPSNSDESLKKPKL